MKILFIADDILLDQEPLGIMTLSAVLKQGGHRTDVVNFDRMPDIRAEVARIGPDILAYSLSSNRNHEIICLNREIKKNFKGLSIFGGPHPSYYPEMIESEGVDVVCRGEGELPFLEFATALEEGKPYHEIENLWVKQNGKIHKNPCRAFWRDLDTLPFVDRDLVRDHVLTVKGSNFIMTGRGCPFDCSYCFNHLARRMGPGRYVRRRSVDNVIREMRLVKERFNTKFFSIQDDTFTMHPSWLEEFAERYPREVDLPFACHGRANLIDERMAELVARSGCVDLTVGLETGNDRLRKEILKKDVPSADYVRTANLAHKYGMTLVTQNICGVPHETVGNVLETIDLNRRCRPVIMQFNFYSPQPGTWLGNYARDNGMYTAGVNAIPRDYFQGVVLNLPGRIDMAWLVRLGNYCLDFRYFFPVVKIVSKLPIPIRRRIFAWLEKKGEEFRKRGRGGDSRAKGWWHFHDTRNPYREFGRAWVEIQEANPARAKRPGFAFLRALLGLR
ncbi:radical SAM protein [Candidatus Sumerlaeota bacterium]|nr:radical SAM protein [Candidatus Sumerlaeota bacterium]